MNPFKEQANRGFENKSHAWIPDPSEGFLIGKIDSEEDGKFNVTLPSGEKVINKKIKSNARI